MKITIELLCLHCNSFASPVCECGKTKFKKLDPLLQPDEVKITYQKKHLRPVDIYQIGTDNLLDTQLCKVWREDNGEIIKIVKWGDWKRAFLLPMPDTREFMKYADQLFHTPVKKVMRKFKWMLHRFFEYQTSNIRKKKQ